MVKRLACAAVCVLAATTMAYAGSVDTYGIGSRATALGGAYTATADDPFAAYYNPAGLSQIEGKVFSMGAHVIDPTIRMSGFSVSNPPINSPIQDASFEDESDILIAPHLGYAQKINDKFALGVAVYAPWGLELDWESDASQNPGAFSAYHSYYRRVGVTPALSYAVNEKLALGVGVTIGKSEAGADRKLYTYETAPSNQFDLSIELEDDVNYSYNLGVMYKPVETITLGLTYRSETDTDFEGDVFVNGVKEANATLEFNHPQQIQAGVRYQPHNRFSIECDVVWTDWSINKEQAEFLDQPVMGRTNLTSERNWEDTKQLRFGMEYILNDMVTLRGGYFYDPTPIPDTTLDMQWPDADKKTYSLGAGFNFGRYTIDAVLQYTDIEQARHIGGESNNLNNAFDPSHAYPASVSASADGYIVGGGITLTTRF